MCGIEGVISRYESVSPELSKLAQDVQNRGEDAAGIGTIDTQGHPHIHKGIGLVRTIFQDTHTLEKLAGTVGIAHVRYKTFGGAGIENAQPFTAKTQDGTTAILSHNGHVRNGEELQKKLQTQGFTFQSTNDAELLLKLFIDTWNKNSGNTLQKISDSTLQILKEVDGGYTITIALRTPTPAHYLLAFKDPHGIRPGLLGKKQNMIAVSSESIALENNGYQKIRDIDPGTLICVDSSLHTKTIPLLPKEPKHCHFEYAYFSRATSFIEGKGINDVRHTLGKELALENKDLWEHIDVITYVPNCPQEMARAFAKTIGKTDQYKTAIEKNRYAGRVFLKESQEIRQDEAERAFSIIPGTVESKTVAVIDDSIVRATNARVITKKLRKAGASAVSWFICTPPIKHPCQWGIDLKTYDELAAAHRTIPQVQTFIEADHLQYISQNTYFRVLSHSDPTILQYKIQKGIFDTPSAKQITPEPFCTHCLDGKIPNSSFGLVQEF